MARIGRPTKPPGRGVKRVTLGLRVPAELKRKLEADAVKAGRTLSGEAQLRLEQSYDREWILEYMAKLLRKEE